MILFSIYWERYDKDLKKILTIFTAIVFFILIGLKYDVGTDSVNYLRIYHNHLYDLEYYNSYNLKFPEVSYALLNIISASFNGGMFVVYLFSGALITFCLVKSCSILKINLFLYLALILPSHIVMLTMSGIRQGISGSLVILAYSLYLSGRKRTFVALVLVATTFHSSAILFLSIFIIDYKKKYLLLLSPLAASVLFYFSLNRYGDYIDADLSNAGLVLRYGHYLLICMVIYYLDRISRNKLPLGLRRNIDYFYLLALLTGLVSVLSSTLSDRISYYLIALSSLFLLHFIRKVDFFKNTSQLVNFILMSAGTTLVVFGYFGNNIENYTYDNYIYRYIVDGKWPELDSRIKIRGGISPSEGDPY